MNYVDVPILMYHEISDTNNPWCVSSEKFAQQIQFLHEQGYKTISLDQLKQGIENNQETNEKLIVITFDDSRLGVYERAFPLLKKYDFTATVYVVPQWIEGHEVPDLENFSQFLSWEQLKELSEQGWGIGSHTNSHQNLTKLNPEELVEELQQAEQLIQEKLNKKVSHFSYPYGAFNETILNTIFSQYQTAVTVQKGFQKSNGNYARQWVLNDTSLEQFKKLLHPPSISLCMIVKDEEQVLERCLQSVKSLVDEIIVVDTGSTDQTKEIAEKFTDKIFDFRWCDDFSAARNESLKHATGDWILILDADEILAEEDHQSIREAVNNQNVAGFQMITRNYSDDSSVSGWQPCNDHLANSFQGWYPSLKVRLFQRNKDVQFQGQMHELIDEEKLKQCGKIAVLKVPVHHYNYNKESKTKNYLELTKKKIKANPENAKAYCELGIQQKQLGKFDLAEKSFQQSLQLDNSPLTPRLNLAIVQQKQGKIDEAIKNYNQILEKKSFADAYFGLGFCYFKRGEFYYSNEWWNSCVFKIRLGDERSGYATSLLAGNLPSPILTKNELEKSGKYFLLAIKHNPRFLDAYINLGAICEKQGNFPAAIKFLRKALLINPQNARIYNNLGVVHEKSMRLGEAVLCYERAIKLNYARKAELQIRVQKIKTFIEKNKES